MGRNRRNKQNITTNLLTKNEEMEDFLEGLIEEFAYTVMREGGKLAASNIFSFISGNSSSAKSTNARLILSGVLYYMNDGTLLYFGNNGRGIVTGYNYYTWGDRWVETNVPFAPVPYNFNGGISHSKKYYRDQYGKLYY